MPWRRFALIASTAVLAAATVAVFLFFDARSHSNSDTIRPFVLTMGPVWLAFGLIWHFTVSRRRGA